MKKILSILICVVLGISSAWAADLTINAKAYVQSNTGGEVAANQSITTPSTGWGVSATNSLKKSHDSSSWGTNKWDGYALFYHARASKGNAFMGWSNDDNSSVDDSQTALCLNVSSTKSFSQFLGGKTADDVKTRYAVFKPILTPQTNNIVLYLAEDGSLSSYTLPIVCNKTKALSISYPTDKFVIDESEVASALQSKNENQEFAIKLSKNPSYTGGFSIGENLYTITLTPSNPNISSTSEYNPAPVVVSVSIRRAPTVTFLPATGGTYTYLQDNGLGQTISVTTEQKLAGVVGNGNDHWFELSATPTTGYRFRRWVINRSMGGIETLYDAKIKSSIECDATVTAEFVSTDYAQFIVLPDTAKHYAYMDDAFDAAKKLGKTVVSVYQPGYVTIKTNADGNATSFTKKINKSEWILPKPSSGTYTIPAGYTLLVPGLEKSSLTGTASVSAEAKNLGYTYLLDKSTVDHFLETNPSPQVICKLNVESGTTINVEGNISVYSCLTTTQGYTGRPTGYGQIHLQDNSHIQLKNGSKLHVMGYITGNPKTTSVVAASGSQVYESFQFTDWRGGTGMAGGNVTNFLLNKSATLVDNSYEVFPVGQYYVQSIETMLQVESGAKEWLTTAVDVSDPFPVTTEFINTMTDGHDLGLFALGADVSIQKYYDGETDRLVFKLIGKGTGGKAKLSYMFLEVKVEFVITVDASLNSSKYVLPINSNIDVFVENVQLDVPYKFAFMPGSVLHVDQTSKLNILNKVYLYDKELNVQPSDVNKGYYGAGNYPLRQITYTAYHGKAPDVRMVYTKSGSTLLADPDTKSRYFDKLNDATFIIDGTLTMDNGTDLDGNSTKGMLFTTDYDSNVTGVTDTSDDAIARDFGANIISNGGGVMNFKVKAPITTINQIDQPNTDPTYVTNIPVCNAWLRNADGTRSAGPNANEGETYMYIDGVWQKPEADLRNPQGNIFTITLPEDKVQNVVCEVVEHNVTGTTFTFSSIEGTFEKVGDISLVDGKLTIPVKYKHQNKHNKDAAANSGKILGTLTYTDPLGLSKTKSVEIPLYGVEDYTPVFDVTVNGQKFSTSGAYANLIIGTGVNEDITLPVVVTPQSGNVASSLVQWVEAQNATTTPFVFNYGEDANKLSSAQLIYRPAQVGDHSGVLTITATYTDANSKPISSSIAITLNAKVDYKPNTLKFASFPNEIYFEDYAVVDGEEPFLMLDAASNNAGTAISYSLSGDNNVVEILGEGTVANPYKVRPIGKGTATIVVEQSASAGVASTHIEKSVTIKSRYDQLPELTFCVDEKVDFDAVNVTADKVSYNTSSNTIDFAPSATWQFQFRGIPHQLTFTPAGDNAWRVMERASIVDEWTAVVQWTNSFVSAQQQVLTLKPTTRQVQIQYGAQTENVGSISGLCVSELQLAADMSKLYLPIYYKEEEQSIKHIVLTHTEATSPTITLASPLTYTATTSENLGTAEEPYYTTTVAITAAHTTSEGTYAFTATQETKTVSVAIRTYNVPQELPIKWADDNAERYYFEMVDSRFAQWNETTKQLLFLNPGTQQRRSVTFAFNGAPSIIKFDLSEDIVDQDWTIEESVDGQSFGVNPSGRDSQDGNTLTHELNYTTRYVRVSYNSSLTNEVILSNLVIEGYPNAIVSPESMFFTTDTKQQHFYMIAVNLQNVSFEIDNEALFNITTDTTFADGWTNLINATEDTHSTALGVNKVDTIFLGVKWMETTALDEGKLTIRNNADNSILAIVPLLGSDSYLVKDKADNTGIYTGIPNGTIDADKNYTYNGNAYTDYEYHSVNLTNAFAEDGTALFDYLFIYGETTPSQGTNITLPMRGSADGSTNIGSNAVTPLIVYKKALNADSKYMGYQFVGQVANVNTAEKEIVGDVIVKDDAGTVFIDVEAKSIRVYMTGFCPFATTGTTKLQEGVFLFRGTHGSKLDLYLEDFHVMSRNKTQNGNAFYGDKEGGETYSENYARGSGGVLVFENVDKQEELQYFQPFEVSIHTIGNNLLNSNHGCFFALQIGGVTAMKAYQVSSPIQVHMQTEEHSRKTKTTLNFDDLWPTAVNATNEITNSKHTNGFLALKKQANNAPSIDMGNEYTIVNFNGGQVELQNSQIGSDTYKTTLAISYRAGFFGSDDAGINLCYGIGTDAVDGTVNFNDGTITIEPMWVAEAYKQYYLIDVDANGNEITRINSGKTEYLTTCLRAPKNTFVRGGSVCRVRACQHVTSKGGAPKDSKIGSLLGQYVYTLQDGDLLDIDTKLVKQINFPANIDKLLEYYSAHSYTYSLNSVTPDANNKLYFWIPDGYGNVTAEQDKFLTTWKACMTQIGAGIEGVAKGTVGGDIEINTEDEVKYFLYCQLDQNIHDVISKTNDNGAYTYQAPIEVPSAAKKYFNGDYTRWAPNLVGDAPEHQVLSGNSYTITDRVYYITTATADLWKTFTAPFNVENVYVVETFSEELLQESRNRSEILVEQARHNADFAAFFGVAMAMGSDKSFKEIYQSYEKWAIIQDRDSSNRWNGEGKYTLRSMQKLTPYFGNNWRDANFYLNENKGIWKSSDENWYGFETKWQTLTQSDTTDGILLHKGSTYSLMFPYCTGCDETIEARTYWDYWSGKFLIFESTAGAQTINGRDFLDETKLGNIFSVTPNNENEVIVKGNSTFAYLQTDRDNVYIYDEGDGFYNSEGFVLKENASDEVTITPTTAFLYGDVPVEPITGRSAIKIMRSGRIVYGGSDEGSTPQGPATDSHLPTVGGGHDLFVTAIDGGVNVAVAETQYIRVVSSAGAVIFSGIVTTSVDIPLPVSGMYIISGQNDAVKVMI